LCVILPIGPLIAAEKVYKTRDKDGNVVFSDVPTTATADAEKAAVEVRETNSYKPAGSSKGNTGNRISWIVDGGEEGEPEFVPYGTLQVLAPLNDAALRDNTGNVSVLLSVEPALATTHRLRLLMDGTVIGDGQTSFFIENVEGGTHSLKIQVIDESGAVLQSSPP